MASRLVYRGGETNEVRVKTSSSYPIEKGDLVYRDSSTKTLRRAQDLSNQGTVALNQDAFSKNFVGVALQKSGLQSGETSFRLVTDENPIRVATTGRFEFECPSTSWNVGDPVAIYAAGTAAIPGSQKVMAADTGSSLQWERAIGVAVPGINALTNAVTRIVVEIKGRVTDPDVADLGSFSGTSGT